MLFACFLYCLQFRANLNLNKVDKAFASAIGLRSYGEVHHGDAHIGSGHDVPHMLGKIIRDLTSDGGKVPFEDWQKMVEVGKGGATLKATLGTKKDAQEADPVHYILPKRQCLIMAWTI